MNPEVSQVLEEAGLRLVGKDDTGKRIEVQKDIERTSIMHHNPFFFFLNLSSGVVSLSL